MKLTGNRIFAAILILSLIVNLSTIFNIQFLSIRPIAAFIYLIFIPGLLITLVLKIRNTNFWEYLVYCVGFSLAFLMFGGLFFNWLLPLVNINQPLSLTPISVSLQILLLITGIIAYLKNSDIILNITLSKPSVLNRGLIIIPLFFPMLSIFGAVSLNNNGSSIFTMMMLGGVALYVSILVIFRKSINDYIYPFSIYFIAISLLFMTSLRGWYTTGHDNQQEYYVFQLTQNSYHWSMSLFQDTYNACLSLNILPTILNSFLNINDLYIYKIIFQGIFPFTVIGVFLLLKKYAITEIAYLSTFFFISFPTFGNDMPMLNRQEIALLFFSLILLVLFNNQLKPRLKEIVFLIFVFSMVVSHYSTSYIATALIVLTYLITLFIKIISRKRKLNLGNNSYYVSLVMVIVMSIFTFLWNAQLTKTSKGLTTLVTQTWQNIGKSFNQDLKSSDVRYSIFNWQKVDKNKLLAEYVATTTQNIESDIYRDVYFDQNIYQQYGITLAEDETLPLKTLGKTMERLSIDGFSFNYYFKQGSAKLMQLLLIIGFIYMLRKKFVYLRKIDSEIYLLSSISIGLLGFFILLPIFSEEYGTLRFFQQTLNILALPTIIGCLTVFSFLKKNLRLYATLAFFLVFFLSLYGFIPQLTGGFYPSLNLKNRGLYYDAYYKHESEVIATKWFTKNYDSQFAVQSSSESSPKNLVFSGFKPVKSILPVTIQKHSYVYLDYSEVTNRKNTVYFKGNSISYNYPMEFLDNNKDLIYSNKQTLIYK
jgi:uncharacterized membrane protein